MRGQGAARKAGRGSHLIGESSPYLLRHARDLVDWYPWKEEAFRRAVEEDKPIFLSIGYSSCHWCHVMEEESFMDEEVADILNRNFVCIKVDREERPDIDAAYMAAAQLLSGVGGWPLTLFLTPMKRPFFAATYLPKENDYGMTGMKTILPIIVQFWKERRAEIEETSEKVMGAVRTRTASMDGGGLGMEVLLEAYHRLRMDYDQRYGGFGRAPKFPVPHRLTFLLRYWKRTHDAYALAMVERTLDAMRRGGIYDQLGGGFHRYSTDSLWFIPHFEKMLYDQALLLIAYVEGWQAAGKGMYERTAREIIEYVLGRMTSPEGGFFSAEDADSEGEEGKFYIWTIEELSSFLTAEEFAEVENVFDVSREGNLREGIHGPLGGKNVLHLVGEGTGATDATMEKMRARRELRPPPFMDDKIMADWNGLMIAALARAYGAWRDPRHGNAARRAAEFVLNHMRIDGTLHHIHRAGRSGGPAFLDDHAFMAWGLLELYAADLRPIWLEEAISLVDIILTEFMDFQNGGFFQSSLSGEKVGEGGPHPVKEVYDGAVPSGNSIALLDLILLYNITGRQEYRIAAERTVTALSGAVFRAPDDHTQFLNAIDLMLGPSSEVVLTGSTDEIEPFLSEMGGSFLPHKVVVHASGNSRISELSPLAHGRTASGGPLAYVCIGRTCFPPTSHPVEMVRLLSKN
ncbi:MAG: thioredoxin domain-containing protein [Euryarchaeota archaeon]|nr:thioredoxin domain-containing protein [Euryarchaeota archaeon]